MAPRAYSGSLAIFSSSKFPDPGLSQESMNVREPVHTMVIDEGGSLIIRVYDHKMAPNDSKVTRFKRADRVWTVGFIIAQFQVSATAMIENSSVFSAVYEENKWLASDQRYVDIECTEARSVEIILRAFYETYTDELSSVTVAEAYLVPDILTALDTPKSKLRFWFSNWLASRDMRNLIRDENNSVLSLCYHFGHGIGAYIVQMNLDFQHLPRSIACYAPVATASLRQLSEINILQRYVKPSDYASVGFSEAFQHEYGRPMEYWSDFRILMMTRDISHLLPKVKDRSAAWETLFHTQFLRFAGWVDDKAKRKDWTETTVWRQDMEGGWVQNAIGLYEDEVLRMGNAFTSDPQARARLQYQLKKIIGRRFHPMQRVEKYWAKKGAGQPISLWGKKYAVLEYPEEMKLAKPGLGEEGIDMDRIFKKMGDLQVRAASHPSDPQDLTAEEAMAEALADLQI